jgi:UDP-N-acetylmuramoyl-tripeptide--D-alanyl-D-alanine ligase
LHRDAGRAAAAARLDALFVVGGEPARELGEAAVASGMTRATVTYFELSAPAAAEIVAAIREGDVVLVKGSRGTRTDLVADRIAEVFG